MYQYRVTRDCFFGKPDEPHVYYYEGDIYTSDKVLKPQPSYMEPMNFELDKKGNVKKTAEAVELTTKKDEKITDTDAGFSIIKKSNNNAYYQQLRVKAREIGLDLDELPDKTLDTLEKALIARGVDIKASEDG